MIVGESVRVVTPSASTRCRLTADHRQTRKKRVKTLLDGSRAVKRSLDQKAKWRVRIAFLFFFVFMVVLSVGSYFVANFDPVKGIISAGKREDLTAMATRAASETRTATEELFDEVEPPALSKVINFGTASRGDLEARRNDLKTAEVNAKTLMPRYIALLKTERDKVENYARSHADGDTVSKFLDDIDKQHAKTTAFASAMLLARADYYRAYEKYVDVLASNFGAYKVENGEIIFQLQGAVDRYNVAAQAMTAAAKRLAELEEERQTLIQSQQNTEQARKDK